ncbi:hypothetical protein [Flavobacterium sp. LC2016-01]|uniref:hypothetical protein n=1 Tax=Flavobacterium sp. LC2016-01 TaxID=2675876 RepID=UPI0012BADA83|nr:hypothetical protein [Flavobacterium sp. LC2016-01]MTH17989.1 hypothetical protein [Flavobacterium sp. LC2016-01]
MKQIYLLLAVFYNTVLLSQTVLTSYPLNFSKELKSAQILTAANHATNEVFVFARTDKELTILKYNSALFLKDKFTFSPEYTEDTLLIGYSFSEDGNPTLYWSSGDGSIITIIKYYFEDKRSKALMFLFPTKTQTLRAEYENNNSFYMLAESKSQSKLILYIFKNGLVEQKELDFSRFNFQNNNATNLNFRQILKENQIEKMEPNEYNSIYKASSKLKVYPLKDRIILTLDNNIKNTQLFDIDLSTLEIKEKYFPQPLGKKAPKTSNSFFRDNKLFQINTNEEQLLFEIKDYNSDQVMKHFDVAKNDTIRFKNSPFQFQKNNSKPRQLKNTASFLKQLSNGTVGLSVFNNQQNIFITIAGVAKKAIFDPYEISNPENIFYGNNPSSFYSTSVFFESIWDKNFNITTSEQEPLATDKIYYFIDKNQKIRMQSILKFKDYFVLGYYDLKTKQYVLRKFTDGYN